MKVAPVSADLLIKLALIAVGVGALWYAINRVSKTAGAAAAWVGETADNVITAVNPVSDQNLIYRGANYITGGDSNQSLGSRLYDWVNPEPPAALPPPRNTGGASGSW